MVIVCCMLWNDRAVDKNYTLNSDHVRVLRNMVERHLTVPHKFVCITNLDISGVETVPLDDSKHIRGTRFNKLSLFKPEMTALGEKILYLDLDTVIVNNIDHLVTRDEDVVFWQNLRFLPEIRVNTSIILHRTGTRPDYWNDFNYDEAVRIVADTYSISMDNARIALERSHWMGSSDQRWLRHRVSSETMWGEESGIYGLGGIKDELPDDACIVFTPGNREPSQKKIQDLHPWITDHYK